MHHSTILVDLEKEGTTEREIFTIEDSETNESAHRADLRILIIGMQGPHVSYSRLYGLACLQAHIEAFPWGTGGSQSLLVARGISKHTFARYHIDAFKLEADHFFNVKKQQQCKEISCLSHTCQSETVIERKNGSLHISQCPTTFHPQLQTA
jgi:hypothetical protein